MRAKGRRLLNVLVAIALLALAAPLMLVIAIAIRLTSRGPVIFVQERVGLDRRSRERPFVADRRSEDQGGRIFHIYKFRTMRHDPSIEGEQKWASRHDPRVTAVGRLLRAYRLDELPQLVNVLKGDMNIVGPRPEQPEIFTELRSEISAYPYRQKVLPGITGLAQVNNGYDESVDDVRNKLELDLRYLDRLSPLEDLRIMMKTAPVMFFRRGSQ